MAAGTQSREVSFAAPADWVESGPIDHLIPRFRLKTRIAVEAVPPGTPAADVIVAEGPPGPAVAARDGITWHLQDTRAGDDDASSFAGWLTSPVGRATITGFAPAFGPAYTVPEGDAPATLAASVPGDPDAGARVALVQCGRCHVIGPVNAMSGMAMAPSFAVMRTFPNWRKRFLDFAGLRPHAPFTRVVGVAEPEGSHVATVEVTPDEIEAIAAYAATVPAADLGAPVQSR